MIVQPTEENMGFDPKLVDARTILDRLSYVSLGGLISSGLFFIVQEIPSLGFVFLITVLMISIDVYLKFTSKNVKDLGDSAKDLSDSAKDLSDSAKDLSGGDDK